MRYLKIFNSSTEIENSLNNGTLGKPYVAINKSEDSVDFNSLESPYYVPLTIEILSGGSFIFSGYTEDLTYNLNNSGWQNADEGETTTIDNLVSGDTIQVIGGQGSTNSMLVSGTAYFNVRGNIMSIFGDGYPTMRSMEGLHSITIFKSSNVVNAYNLLLPATELINGAYSTMFSGCTSLTTAPSILPATNLSGTNVCYNSMFNGCTSLTSTPELPATVLGTNSYMRMFYGCSSLTTLPTLTATTLNSGCYDSMFGECTGLTTVPSNYLPASILATKCYNGMFKLCTSLTTAPELLADYIEDRSYAGMFSGCTSLNYIKCTATSVNGTVSSTLKNWVTGVANEGTFVKNSNASFWTFGNNGIPSGWTVSD